MTVNTPCFNAFSFLATLIISVLAQACYAERFHSELHDYEVNIVAEGLNQPWGMAFLPNGNILVTEKPGRLRLIKNGRLVEHPVVVLPDTVYRGQGGLMGIALHPQFSDNNMIYLSYNAKGKDGHGTEVIRGQFKNDKLINIEIIFRALPKSNSRRHFGSRLVFARDGSLFISLGERGENPSKGYQHAAQDLSNHLGSLIHINDDGSVPSDNPFVSNMNNMPELYTFGNRNMQGMALHPNTGEVWTHEHGPQGGDEINIMRPGVNYGWPIITYGVNYFVGTKIGEGTHKQGMEQPIYKWIPSIAPSGMVFYTGDKFSNWTGNLFVGSLKFGLLVRLEVSGNIITSEERLLNFQYGRIREVVQGVDGFIYLLTDDSNGKLLRMTPVIQD